MAPRRATQKEGEFGQGTNWMLVDADGCELTVGQTSYVPWRWGRAPLASIGSCRLSHGVRMTDPETGEDLPRYHEVAFEEAGAGFEEGLDVQAPCENGKSGRPAGMG